MDHAKQSRAVPSESRRLRIVPNNRPTCRVQFVASEPKPLGTYAFPFKTGNTSEKCKRERQVYRSGRGNRSSVVVDGGRKTPVNRCLWHGVARQRRMSRGNLSNTKQFIRQLFG